MTDCAQKIRATIRNGGPMDVTSFMTLCVSHYYATRDPFGAAGDFTTAPEISQMFGELLGLCLADGWQNLGAPAAFTLLECGPGRGTLMADMLRATRNVPGFHAAARIVLMETSPVLREKQKNMLASYDVRWIETLADLATESDPGPLFCVANEFLDALPIRQAVFQGGQWRERRIGLTGEDEDFVFGAGAPVAPPPCPTPQDGTVFEWSPAREGFVRALSVSLKERGGFALLIDYGHTKTGLGDTLQAVKAHKFVSVLKKPGAADLTSHVDFAAISRAAKEEGVYVQGATPQGAFLERLGIAARAARLDQRGEQERLCAPDRMGTLFKVMALCGEERATLAGF